MPTPERERLVAVQILRALAAFLVLFGHAQTEASQMSGTTFARLVFPWGAGVDIFFVISGFIMVYASKDLFGTPGSWRTFLSMRLWRIVPLYYFYTLAMIAALLVFPSQLNSSVLSASGIVKSLLFIPFENEVGKFRPVLGLGWTLNYEMFFYALFALVIPLSSRRAVPALAILLAGLVLFGGMVQPTWAPLAFWTHPIILEFGAGALLGHLYVRYTPVPAGSAGWLVQAAVVLMLGILLLGFYRPDFLARPLGWGLIGLALLYLAVWHAPTIASPIAKRVLVVLGDSSYSLYLSHPFSLALWKMAWPLKADRASDWAFVLSATIFATLIGVASYYILERFILARLKPLLFPAPPPVEGRRT